MEPNFLGIGVQKGGTTTLHNWLASHPDVYLPVQKELHYYSLNYERGADWYRAQFDGATAGQVCGEITPYYVFHPYAVSRSEIDNPGRRLIVLLRDPVARSLSHYFHSRRLGLEPLEVEAALDAEGDRLLGAEDVLAGAGSHHLSHQEHSYISRSRYEYQLERLEGQIQQGRLLMLRSEDLFEKPQHSWQQVLQFLELNTSIPLEQPDLVANKGGGENLLIGEAIRERLREQLEPTYQALASRYGIKW